MPLHVHKTGGTWETDIYKFRSSKRNFFFFFFPFLSFADSSTARHTDAKCSQLVYIVVNVRKRKKASGCFGGAPGDGESKRDITNKVSPPESVYG